MSTRSRRAAFGQAVGAAAAGGPTGFMSRLTSLPSLIADVLRGRYTGVSRGKLALMAAAALYIVSPVDLLPEALLTIPGLADDALVAAWLVTGLVGATEGYRAWRTGRPEPAGPPPGPGPRVVPGEVVPPAPA